MAGDLTWERAPRAAIGTFRLLVTQIAGFVGAQPPCDTTAHAGVEEKILGANERTPAKASVEESCKKKSKVQRR